MMMKPRVILSSYTENTKYEDDSQADDVITDEDDLEGDSDGSDVEESGIHVPVVKIS